MGCNCGKPKCDGQCGCKSPAVLQINNPPEYITFHKVSVPAVMGDSTTNPPAIGKYKNVLLYYEADQTSWLYSTDGIPTKLTNGITNYEDAINLPQINGHTLLGNQSSSDLGLQGELTAGANIQINGNVISATDTTYTAGNGIELDGTEIKAKIGDGLEFDGNGEIDIADIEQYAHFFDTVASMKNADNLIDGSYARTMGYYAKNDGGGATYKIREITNDDVVDEASIIEMGDGSDELIAELIIEEPINVKTLGVYGDGTHDDYAKIQLGINKFKHNTLYFPSGEYLISQPLSIGASNDDQVDFKLESDAIIKTNLVIDSLLEIAKSGSGYTASGLGSIVTIDGGVWDATNCQRAIYTTDIRKNTMLKNMSINNVSNYGIYVSHVSGQNGSSDLNIDNVVINGSGSEGSSVGLYLAASYDNKIRNCRINSCHVGIHDHGGSYYQNIHVLGYWHDGEMTKTNYESSIAYKLDGAGGVVKMQECYSDTMGIGWQINSDVRVYISNSQSYHYLTNLEYTTILFDYNYSNATGRLFVNQFEYNPPTVTGEGKNIGLDLSGTSSDFRNYLTTYWVFKFSQIEINHARVSTLSENDYIFCRSLYTEDNFVNIGPWQFTMEANKYYPIAILRGVSAYNLQIGMAFDQLIEVSFTSDSVGRMSVRNLINWNHTGEYTLALCNFDTVDGIRQSYLCIKSSTASGLNPSIKGFHNWNNQVMTRPYYSSKPLENPTVVSESSFNP